jgi:hypothetical protein
MNLYLNARVPRYRPNGTQRAPPTVGKTIAGRITTGAATVVVPTIATFLAMDVGINYY